MWNIKSRQLPLVVGNCYETFFRGTFQVGRIVKIEPYYNKTDNVVRLVKAKHGFGKCSPDRYNIRENVRVYLMDREKKWLRPYNPLALLYPSPQIMSEKSNILFQRRLNHITNTLEINFDNMMDIAKRRFGTNPFTIEDIALAMYETLGKRRISSNLDKTNISKPKDIRAYDCLVKASRELLQKNWEAFDPLSADIFHIIPEEDMVLRTNIKKSLENKLLVYDFITKCRTIMQIKFDIDDVNRDRVVKESDQAAFKLDTLPQKPKDPLDLETLKQEVRKDFDICIKAILLYIRQGDRSWFQPYLSDAIHQSLLYPLEIDRSRKSAFHLLELLGVDTDVEPLFYVSKIEGNSVAGVSWASVDIAEEVEKHALDLVNSHIERDYINIDKDFERRVDFSHMSSYAIDDVSTTEVDDCFSIDPKDPNKIYIHIADPTTVVTPHSELDLDARRRVSSLYLPHLKKSMIPKLLATDQFTLRDNHPNRGLTFIVTLNPITGNIEDYDVVVSRFSHMMRVSYEVANSMIESKGDTVDSLVVKDLYKIAQLRKKNRASSNLHLPNFSVTVKDGSIVVEKEIHLKSHDLVEEMMILCGEVAAKMAYEKKIIIPYRYCGPILAAGERTEDLTLNESLRRLLKTQAASTGIEPLPHIPMGLPYYTRASSPIRRYTDIIVHHQLKSFLRTGLTALPFNKSVLKPLISDIDKTEKLINKVQKDSERYWKEKYMSLYPNKKWKAAVITIDQTLGVALPPQNTIDLRMRVYVYDVGLIVSINTREIMPHVSLDDDVLIQANFYQGKPTFCITDVLKQGEEV